MQRFGSDQARPRVFVYCDDPSHGGRVAVAAFCPGNPDSARWDEWRAGPASESGMTLGGPRCRLECGKCGERTVAVLPEETLFEVLDALDDNDVSHVTLSALAAAAEHISGARP